jgi:hypothetical protein
MYFLIKRLFTWLFPGVCELPQEYLIATESYTISRMMFDRFCGHCGYPVEHHSNTYRYNSDPFEIPEYDDLGG